jgi:ketosteroid isomerase-like protein
MRRLFPALLSALILFAAWAPRGSAETDDASHPAALMIIKFNEAITARDMDTAMSLLADGGVQFNLHPAHPGMPVDHPLTEDMPTMWKTVSPILFSTTDSYERTVRIDDVHTDGELAVVWTQTKTVTYRKGKTEPMVLNFSEMYFLVNKDDTGWLIAGTATNRPVDTIPVG